MPDLFSTTNIDDEDVPLADMPPDERHRYLKAALAAGIFFIWDTTRQRYVSTETEHLVLASTVRNYVRIIGDTAQARMRDLTIAKTQGQISQAAWELAMRDEVKNLHRSMAVIAKGGVDQMTLRDWGRVGRIVADQNAYLDKFGAESSLGQMSDAQQVARAQLYARAGFSTFENGLAVRNIERGVERGRRVLEPGAAHCDECPDLATEEFIPINDIVPIGDTPCQANCRCTIEYEDLPPEGAATDADQTTADAADTADAA